MNVQTDKAMLSPARLDVPRKTNCGTTLVVFPPQTQAIYDTTQMACAIQHHQVAYFGRHEWAETPSRMLLPLLVSALQSTGCFNAVVAPPHAYATPMRRVRTSSSCGRTSPPTGLPTREVDAYAWKPLDRLEAWCGKHMTRVLLALDWPHIERLPEVAAVPVRFR